MTQRILLDVDGVLCDYISACAAWCRRKGVKDASHDTCTQWDPFEAWGCKELEPGFERHAARRDFCIELKECQMAQRLVRLLRQQGEVIVVTSPLNCAPQWCSDRAKWLDKHFGFRRDEIVFTKRKDLVAGDVLVDDSPEHCAKQRAAVLVDRPWNADAYVWEMPGWKRRVDAIADEVAEAVSDALSWRAKAA